MPYEIIFAALSFLVGISMTISFGFAWALKTTYEEKKKIVTKYLELHTAIESAKTDVINSLVSAQEGDERGPSITRPRKMDA